MSQFSKMKHSRDQWKHKATQRSERERYQRKQSARFKAERDRVTQALQETQARLRPLEAKLHGLATVPKVDVVYLALQLFFVARIGFRAVSRVLTLLALALGIKRAPCPHTIITWVIRLSIVRLESARPPAGCAPEPSALQQRPDLDGRSQYWPGRGQDMTGVWRILRMAQIEHKRISVYARSAT